MNLQSTLRSLLVLQAPAWERPAPKLRFVANLLINTMRHPLSGLQEPKHISPEHFPISQSPQQTTTKFFPKCSNFLLTNK